MAWRAVVGPRAVRYSISYRPPNKKQGSKKGGLISTGKIRNPGAVYTEFSVERTLFQTENPAWSAFLFVVGVPVLYRAHSALRADLHTET